MQTKVVMIILKRETTASLLVLILILSVSSTFQEVITLPSANAQPNIELVGTPDMNVIAVGEIVHVSMSVRNLGDVEARSLEYGAKADNEYLEHITQTVPSGTSEHLDVGASMQFSFDVRGKAEGRGTIGAWVVYHDLQGKTYDFLNREAVVIQVTAQPATTQSTTTAATAPSDSVSVYSVSVAGALVLIVVGLVVALLLTRRKSVTYRTYPKETQDEEVREW
jgi:hypothetical protein